jgi:enamine deaminase RidA (YjgF/YER057c/UK114 family)
MIEEKLASLGFSISQTPRPAGSYVPVIKSGSLIFVSGQIPFTANSNTLPEKYIGKIPDTASIDVGREAAKICVINCLSHIKSFIGDLDLLTRFIKLTGYVNCSPDFTEHPKVINGASDFLIELFGEKGRHTRVALGAISLPLGSIVEIDFLCEVKSENNN